MGWVENELLAPDFINGEATRVGGGFWGRTSVLGQAFIYPPTHPYTHPPPIHTPTRHPSPGPGLRAGGQRWVQLSRAPSLGGRLDPVGFSGGLGSPQHFEISSVPHARCGDRHRPLAADSFGWVWVSGQRRAVGLREQRSRPVTS